MKDIVWKDQEILPKALYFARWALAHAQDLNYDRERYDASYLYQHAIARCIIAGGEAANKLDKDTKEALPHVPWKDIIDMRHRLAHSYDEVDWDIIWDVVTDYFPRLISELEPLVGESPLE